MKKIIILILIVIMPQIAFASVEILHIDSCNKIDNINEFSDYDFFIKNEKTDEIYTLIKDECIPKKMYFKNEIDFNVTSPLFAMKKTDNIKNESSASSSKYIAKSISGFDDTIGVDEDYHDQVSKKVFIYHISEINDKVIDLELVNHEYVFADGEVTNSLIRNKTIKDYIVGNPHFISKMLYIIVLIVILLIIFLVILFRHKKS